MAEGENNADEIFKEQPNFLMSVVALRQFGMDYGSIDVALKFLIACHLALKKSGVELPTISHDLQEKAHRRIVGRIRFLEGLPKGMSTIAINEQIDNDPEPHLFAAAYTVLAENDLLIPPIGGDNRLMLAVFNIVESIALALHGEQG
jgi:hypothetical protein